MIWIVSLSYRMPYGDCAVMRAATDQELGDAQLRCAAVVELLRWCRRRSFVFVIFSLRCVIVILVVMRHCCVVLLGCWGAVSIVMWYICELLYDACKHLFCIQVSMFQSSICVAYKHLSCKQAFVLPASVCVECKHLCCMFALWSQVKQGPAPCPCVLIVPDDVQKQQVVSIFACIYVCEWIDAWMDGWLDGFMDGWTDTCAYYTSTCS